MVRLSVVIGLAAGLLGLSSCTSAPRKAPTPEKGMKIAFVLLGKPGPVGAGDVQRAFPTFAGEACTFHPTPDANGKDDVLAFDLGSCGQGFIGLVPTPVPNREADEAANRSVSAIGTGWKLPPHAAHLIVALTDDGWPTPTQRMQRLTWLVAAVTQATGAVGVYLGDAGATHDPKFFTSVAKDTEMVAQLMLWNGVSAVREADGRLSLLSLGMKQLGLPNLLLVSPASRPAGDALETFFNLLTYVAARGEGLPEGDTVGGTPDERLPVHYVPSPADPKETVWRVELK